MWSIWNSLGLISKTVKLEHCVRTQYHRGWGRHGEWKQTGTGVLKERLAMPMGYVVGKEENYNEEGLRATDHCNILWLKIFFNTLMMDLLGMCVGSCLSSFMNEY